MVSAVWSEGKPLSAGCANSGAVWSVTNGRVS